MTEDHMRMLHGPELRAWLKELFARSFATERQVMAFLLHADGWGATAIGDALGITKQSAQGLVNDAGRRLRYAYAGRKLTPPLEGFRA